MTAPDQRLTSAEPGELADVLADVARSLLEEDDQQHVLERISTAAVETIGPAQHCGITVVEKHQVTTPASTDVIPALVDQLQCDTGQGPCFDAIRHHDVFRSDDLTAGRERWPDFAARVADESPVRSVMSFRLFASDRTYCAGPNGRT